MVFGVKYFGNQDIMLNGVVRNPGVETRVLFVWVGTSGTLAPAGGF